MKRTFLIIFISALLLSKCRNVEQSEFEKASGISLPAEAKNTESYDDEKLVKTAAFTIDSVRLKNWITTHQFQKFNNTDLPQFWGVNYLKEKPDFSDLGGFYYKSGVTGNLSWIYIADLHSQRLWTEIKYPGKPAY